MGTCRITKKHRYNGTSPLVNLYLRIMHFRDIRSHFISGLIMLSFTLPGWSQTGQYSNQKILDMLSYSPQKAKVVIDTDAYNEVDDQFALVYAMLSGQQMEIEAIYAAPFLNKRSISAEDGMKKSYDEILNILDRMNAAGRYPVFKGSGSFLKDKSQPVISDAAKDLVNRALNSKEPLYVLTLGAPTNIASALTMEPKIRDKIIVVWLGGKGLNWNTASEFNLMQDILSSQILFDSGVPLIQIPTEPVTSHLSVTVPELKFYIGGLNKISDYLVSIVDNYYSDQLGVAKILWDISVIAYVIDPTWFNIDTRTVPILTNNLTYSFTGNRHLYKVATYINRNKVFKDLYTKFRSFREN